MSLRSMPSRFALRIGHNSTHDFVWAGIADNLSPGIHVSETLPIAVSRRLLEQATGGRLIVTDVPERGKGFPVVSPDDGVESRIQTLLGRPDRTSLAMIVFDVAPDGWTADLIESCKTVLRLGRPCGVYVVVNGTIPAALSPAVGEANAGPIALHLTHDTEAAYPALIAHHPGAQEEWMGQTLTFGESAE